MSRTRILVVEDETIVALDVKERLTELGYEVTGVAERGDQALDLVNATRPDLVLMDIRLKGEMDGITAAEKIRQRWRIPVIYLTAFSEDPTFQRAKVTEPFGYIIKPVEDREIQWAIEMALYKHQAEQRLRESEARYRSLFEANPYPMWVYDLESLAFLAVNDAAVAHYGYGREEFLAMTIADIRPLEEIPQLMESVGRVGERPLNSKDIWRHRKKEGSIIDVEITSHILDYQGRRARLVLANDVTERLAMETALQKREKELTLLTDNMIDMISYIDQDRIIRYMSPSIRFVLGYEPLELIGQTALDLVHPDDRDRLLQEAGRALAEKAPTLKLEYRYRRAAGDYLWLESLCRFMRDDQGQLQGTVFSTRDISARRQAEEDLRRSESQYRLLAENTSDVVWLLDLTPGRFEYVSPSVERLRGFSAEEVMAQSIAEVMTPDSFRKTVEPLPARLAAFAAGDESMRRQIIEVDQPCKNGRVITVEILTALITGEDGQVAKIAGSSRDITQRKKLEAALRVKDERLQKLVQNMPAMLIAWDGDGRLVARNREWSQVTGYQPEEIPFLGDLMESMYPDPVYRASIMEEWRRRGNFFRDWESELTAKDGTKRSVSWSSIADQFPVPGWDSWAIGVDLTDRRMAEEALRKSRDELEVRVKERTSELESGEHKPPTGNP